MYPNLSIDDDDIDISLEQNQSPRKDDGIFERDKTPRLHNTLSMDSERAVLEENQSSKLWIYIIAISVLLIGIALFLFSSKESSSQKPIIKSSSLSSIDCSQFMSLEKKFKNQDKKLFKSLKSGIEGIYNRTPQVPSVFTFFSTDDDAIDKLLKEVVKIAKACIKQHHDPINLTMEDLASSNFIARYKDELTKRKIMIIEHVDLMPISTVHLLHSFADTYNPIVSDSILYFTVRVPQKPDGKPIDYIHDYLQEKWKGLASNMRDPLITRFLDQTFFINSASWYVNHEENH